MKKMSVESALAEAMTVKLDTNISVLAEEGIAIPTLEDLVKRNTAGMEKQSPSPRELRQTAAKKAFE
jgi:hypothetical protein